MAYVAVKGGMAAILAAERLVKSGLAPEGVSPLEIEQILTQQRPLVDQVMGEGGLYAPELAALAVRQAEGDPMEAAFLLRAYRSTLSRIGYTLPADPMCMDVRRRISPAFKDVPGGQVLGRTRDYTQHLLDFSLLHTPGGDAAGSDVEPANAAAIAEPPAFPRVSTWLRETGVLPPVDPEAAAEEPFDITRDALAHPFPRSARLQALARGETGAMVAFAYTTMRDGWSHDIPAELRVGDVPFHIVHPLTGNNVRAGSVTMTEVEMVVEPSGSTHGEAGSLSLAYGLVFGQNERKAIAMSILDGALSQESDRLAVNDPEFVLYHIDGIESQGFVEHLKLPHHVTFQASLDRLRYLQQLYATQPEDSDAHDR